MLGCCSCTTQLVVASLVASCLLAHLPVFQKRGGEQTLRWRVVALTWNHNPAVSHSMMLLLAGEHVLCLGDRQGKEQTANSAEALLFITGLLVEGRATADAAGTLKVLRHLAQEPESEGAFVAVLQAAPLQGVCPAYTSYWTSLGSATQPGPQSPGCLSCSLHLICACARHLAKSEKRHKLVEQ